MLDQREDQLLRWPLLLGHLVGGPPNSLIFQALRWKVRWRFRMIRKWLTGVAAVAALVVGSLVMSAPAGAAIDTMTPVPSPNAGTSSDSLNSVSCVTASWCVAVGATDTGSASEMLIETTKPGDCVASLSGGSATDAGVGCQELDRTRHTGSSCCNPLTRRVGDVESALRSRSPQGTGP